MAKTNSFSIHYVGCGYDSLISYQLILFHRTGSDSYEIVKSWLCRNLTEVFRILHKPMIDAF